MVVESHLPFGGEAGPPQDEPGFEAAKPRRKSRRERRAEHARVHEHLPVLEPHTIWTREDPNHLQPLRVEAPAPEPAKATPDTAASRDERKTPRNVEHEPVQAREQKVAERPTPTKAAGEKRREETPRPGPLAPEAAHILPSETAIPAPQQPEAPKQRDSQPEPLAELLKLQALPKLNIQRRNFYTEPEVRRPNATEIEHDILPPTRQEGKSADAPAPAEQPRAAVSEVPPIPGLSNAAELQPAPEAGHTEWQQPAGTAAGSEQTHTGEQLQRIAEETARHAAELADKEERRRAAVVPEEAAKERPAAPEGQFGGKEIEVSMERADLLALGDSIRVDGVSVSEIFHAGRLDEEGLRRIVAAFLRGHDTQRVIAEEVLRVQMRFERDPQLRQTALRRSSRTTKRSAGATIQAKKVFDPKRARHHADHFADRLAGGIDRMMESAEGQPNMAKSVGIALAVIIYFVILILILKS